MTEMPVVGLPKGVATLLRGQTSPSWPRRSPAKRGSFHRAVLESPPRRAVDGGAWLSRKGPGSTGGADGAFGKGDALALLASIRLTNCYGAYMSEQAPSGSEPSPGAEMPGEPRAGVALTLLGAFTLAEAGGAVGVQSAAQRVVALLAIRERTMSRPVIAGILWPDAPEANALGRLRSILWRLGSHIRENLDITITDLTLSPDVQVDLRLARALGRRLIAENLIVDEADLGHPAVVLLSSELLPDWYDDWLTDDARQWHELRVHALESLSERLTAMGRFEAAIEAALAAITAEPLRESSYAALIRVYLQEGDRPGALKVLARYKAVLHDDLHEQPTTKLENLILNATLPPARGSSAVQQARTAAAGEETGAFEVIASGISMEPSIRHGDTLMVSREVPLAAGRVVVAIHDDAWIVKRLAMRDGKLVLRSDNADEEVALEHVAVQGVVVQLQRII